jgi:hypothetical protein
MRIVGALRSTLSYNKEDQIVMPLQGCVQSGPYVLWYRHSWTDIPDAEELSIDTDCFPETTEWLLARYNVVYLVWKLDKSTGKKQREHGAIIEKVGGMTMITSGY